MDGYNVGAIFYELTYGIKGIDISSRVETFYNPNVQVPLTYSVRLDETIGDAFIRVTSTEASDIPFLQTIREQSLFAGDWYTFSDKLNFNELGYYDLIIEVMKYVGDGEYEVVETSSNFNVQVVDLPSEIPGSDVYIVAPEENNNGVFWFSTLLTDGFDSNLAVIEGTPIAYCDWSLKYNGEGQTVKGAPMEAPVFRDVVFFTLFDIQEEENVSTCSVKLYKDIFAAEGTYILKETAQFTGDVQPGVTYIEDEMLVGVDNTAPEIISVIPQAGAYSGELRVTVDTTDALSGVDEVWVTINDKTTPSISFTVQAEYNEGTGLYDAVFDTIEMGIPDGSYDVTAEVYDVAGNMAELTVDPAIDNTAPTINLEEGTIAAVVYEGSDVDYFRVFLTDNLAGIDDSSVSLNFVDTGTDVTIGSCQMDKKRGDDFGAYFHTVNCNIPFFNEETDVDRDVYVTITGGDKASPSNIGTLNI